MKRILRVSEARELIRNINAKDQGIFRRMEISSGDARMWFQAMLFTGMRTSELIKLKQNPTDRNGIPLFQRNGTIRLDKEIFYDTGKRRQVARERIVIMSGQGRAIMHRFMSETGMPKMIYDKTLTAAEMSSVFGAMLKASADRIGLELRPFGRTVNKTLKDGYGSIVYDNDGGKQTQRVVVPQDTTGVVLRSFRASWESWLVSTRGKDELALINICTSIGHTRATALEYYLASQFDADDMRDMLTVTEGFGVLPETTTVEDDQKSTP